MNLTKELKEIPYLRLLSRLARQKRNSLWLVGGFLRDLCLKGKARCSYPGRHGAVDFDFCLARSPRAFAAEFARAVKSKVILLDKDTPVLRVALRRKGKFYTYDFSSLRAKTIKDDLALRDFSINTLAVDLTSSPAVLIDTCGVTKDLKCRRLRAAGKSAFKDDPLRILRGFSFMAGYNFSIEAKTKKLMNAARKDIARVSGERISEELFKILASDSSFAAVKLMSDMKVIDRIVPHLSRMRGVRQGGYHHLGVWKHSLETLRQFERLYLRISRSGRDISDYLHTPLAQNRSRAQVIKLACLLHDIGKPQAKKRRGKKTIFYRHEKIGADLARVIASSLRLSARETDFLRKLIFNHLRPGYLADQVKPSRRAVYRFFSRAQQEGPAIILLSLADWRATRGPLTNPARRLRHERIMLGLLHDYFAGLKVKPPVKLIDGYDIMSKFKLAPSVLIGKLLKAVAEEQALGHIHTRKEAYGLVRNILKKT